MYFRQKSNPVLQISIRMVICGVLFLGCALSVSATNIPIASTVALESAVPVAEGVVIVADEEESIYTVSSSAADSRVYGVTAELPPVVFSTGTNTVPVITEGVTMVQVTDENGSIERGDLLVSAHTSGAAMRAGDDDVYVFAVALESYDGVDSIGQIQAEIGKAKALALRESQIASRTSAETEGDTENKLTLFRGVVAAVLVIGALFFCIV